jgi:hypothetical protein
VNKKPYIYLQSYGGFGNRITMWEVAYQINKLNDFRFDIVVGTKEFGEIEYLEYPYTIGVIDSKKYWNNTKWIKLDNYMNLDILHPYGETLNWRLQASDMCDYFEKKFYSNSDRPYQLIDMKDEKLKDKIIRKMRNCIGVHIRRGDVVIAHQDKSNPDHGVQEYLPDEYFINLCDKIIEKNPKQKFYLSTDGSWDQVKFFYDRYDVIDAYYVLNNEREPKLLREKFRATGIWPHTFNLYSVIDLFSLIYTKMLISSRSAWSDFCRLYKNHKNVINPCDSKNSLYLGAI